MSAAIRSWSGTNLSPSSLNHLTEEWKRMAKATTEVMVKVRFEPVFWNQRNEWCINTEVVQVLQSWETAWEKSRVVMESRRRRHGK